MTESRSFELSSFGVDLEIAYYGARRKDVGLVTVFTHVQPNGVCFTGYFVSYDDSFFPGLTSLATAAKSGGALEILKIFHAGIKAAFDLTSDIVAASAVRSETGPSNPSLMPGSMNDAELIDMVGAFGEANWRAIDADFDSVEVHGAHDFMPPNFISPHVNTRGGSFQKTSALSPGGGRGRPANQGCAGVGG